MSLHDRYNRGGGRLDNLDRYLTHLGNRAGNLWLDRTGLGRHVLTRSLYLFAVWAALQHVAIVREPMMLMPVGLALMGLFGVGQSRGGLVEQIQVEALGLPKSTFAFLRVFLLFVGGFGLATGLGLLGAALQDGTAVPLAAVTELLGGGAFVALQAGDYIRRTNPPTISNGRGLGV